jgi:hypothetical protein
MDEIQRARADDKKGLEGIQLGIFTAQHIDQVKQVVSVSLPAGAQYTSKLYARLLTVDPCFRVVGMLLR